jgi:CRP-like cAMP-binding protein
VTLEAELIESLASRSRSLTLTDGQVLVEQGDAADKVYFIESGRVAASKTTPQGDVVVGTVGPAR